VFPEAVDVIGVTSEHCTNEFSNYRILTPPLRAFHVPHGDFFRPANYPFSTPRKKDSEFRIQSPEYFKNPGVRNR
jgi:hypothetical protein